MFFAVFIILQVVVCSFLYASTENFVSLRSNKANLREGPGSSYSIKWTYINKNMPLRSIDKLGDWTKVCDIEGGEGWINSSLLSKSSYVMTKSDALAYKKPNLSSIIVMKLDKFAVIKLDKCDEQWCLISASRRSAWIPKEAIWH